ncbi:MULTISPECIES: ABC-F family ATP-binding cassette domain-containing protein [unclassified Gemella]|uniref:ABC-F family ATP-binding cassette domain-containing protein n=1 Tax=unclassified Gemella TaxID=2624949 RepID=UPI0015D0B324|nr:MULTISPECIES: ABC-F family ATP-binding cassette domain-containing protein [unclassified Gemella]MBF0710427.1 ABC-F family ATP-binding cassette domain-containing protein [Gemella sp. GL1.1]NYS27771.1 ABC-F family ATP-binding cassette domain-containing protein [Gemella sp. GL1]
MLLQLNNISKYFVVTEVFSKVKLEINEKDKIAIVGRNGAGKSTLLKVIAGITSYDSGERVVSKNVSIGYLSQEFIVKEDKTVYEEMLSCFDEIISLEKELERLSEELTAENLESDHGLLNRYDALQNMVLTHNDYHYKSKIKSVLYGLDFSENDLNKSISNFSGGQKTRISMAKLLLSEPDILILDEPTNHLDMENVAWLENYLNAYPGAVVVVSHDRYFLDKIVNIVYNVEFGRTKKYVGNYSKFLKQYEEDYEKHLREYISQQKDIKKLEDFVQKNIARSSTSGMAKSRQKILDRIERIDNPRKDEKRAHIEFSINEQSGRDVLRIFDLKVGYEKEQIGPSYNIDVYKGDRIAIVGRNGVGKSTLIKAIAKKSDFLDGEVTYGSKVSLGYYDQKQAEFESVKTILQELWDEYPNMKEADVRSVLGRFLFSGEDVLKLVRDLSGGEKARLQLAKLMLEKNNLLILDEPTNHLDIVSKQVLESALENYEGTLIFVSHDRYFINKIANKIIFIDENKYNLYLGNFDYYLEKREQEKIAQEIAGKEDKKELVREKNSYALGKEEKKLHRKLERERDAVVIDIETLEEEISKINKELVKEEVYTDVEKTQEYNTKLQEANLKLEELNERWLELEEELENMEGN